MNGLGRVLDIKAKYSKKYLSDKLKEHLNNHIVDYEKAMGVYKLDMISALKELTDASMNAMATFDKVTIQKAYNKINAITKPVDATKAYKQYIDLLFAASDEFIELTMHDANAIINDEWDWAVQAKMTNSFYSSR